MHLMIRPIMPYDMPKLTENPFVLISGFVLLITAVLIAVVLSRYAAEAYKGNRKKATLFFAGITAFVTLMNSYFVDNPDMIMGEMKMITGPHSMQSACIAYEDQSLSEQLAQAIENIHAEITEYEYEDLTDEEEDLSIPADPEVRNFSYTVVDGKIYYRENSRMKPVDVSVTAENRIKGMIGIRDCVRTLIEYQTEDYPEADIKAKQEKLNELYDAFSKKYGLINSRANNSAFNSDSSYSLLSSLEVLDDEGNFVRKADMFSKRTIKQKVTVTSVDTETILSTARRHLCQLAVLKFQQTDGLNTVLPIGCKKIQATRTLTTESLAVFMPFKVQEVAHEHGIYYGQNAISNNMIIANRKCLLNGNSFILGVSGSGKSFTGKCEIANLMLAGDSDIIIIDPEREYAPLVKAMGGAIIDISATSKNHINAMDMNSDYGDGEDPLILKSEFILSLCEQLIGSRSLGAQEKSLIDRCAKNVYRNYRKRGYKGKVPTLKDFRADLLKQSEPEAQEIALAIELFTDGSLNTFAKETNVDVNNRLICYDILDLGKQLLPIGMLVVLDSILNRITANRAKGKNTFIIIDEIYLLFQHEYSANFLFTLWKRVRKYGAFCTGITQNVDDLLQSHTARTMLANSEFVIMLNQASTDRIKLAELLNISDTQLSYITNVEAGRGLMKVGSALVPFVNKFPKNTQLYALMTTKFGER